VFGILMPAMNSGDTVLLFRQFEETLEFLENNF
jgi:hypothetical protein